MTVYLASSNFVENFVTRGYKHVGMRLAYFACPYPYAFVKRERPRDAKFFYGITENKKSANEHLTQTKQRKTLKKNLICAILNTVAQAANFDTIGGNYYVQI